MSPGGKYLRFQQSNKKGFNKLLSTSEPTKSSAPCSVIIHITAVSKDTGYFMDMMIPRVHSYTEEKNAKGTAHIHTVVQCKRRAEKGANFMKDSSTKQNMATIGENPIRGTPEKKHVHDPMWVNPLKSFGQVGEQDTGLL